MKVVRNISIFLSVAFALIFFGKIDKISLFQDYFKRISEVEMRNSTDVDDAAFAFTQLTETSTQTSNNHFVAILPTLTSFENVAHLSFLKKVFPQSVKLTNVSHWFLTCVAPMAP